MDVELIDRLRTDLSVASYDAATVASVLGAEADQARHRGVFEPARRVLIESVVDEPLLDLIRIFLLGESLTEARLGAALPRLGVADAVRMGLVEETSGVFRAALSLNPVSVDDAQLTEPAQWWIISDLDDQLRGGPARPDHVMGVGGATRSLIAQAPPGVFSRTLDLGTGCGIVALHLSLRGTVTATDISPRALDIARANARLNGVEGIEFRLGNLFEPVFADEFDLILSNPPFVVSPGDAPERYEYREAGMVGDALVEHVVRGGAERLAVGGTLLCLANWESQWGRDGLERVRQWIIETSEADPASDTQLAGWVIERERVGPALYAETWARDGGIRQGTEEFDVLVRRWLDDFASRRIVSIGLGSIRLGKIRLSDADASRMWDPPLVHIERAEGAFSGAAGARLAEAFEAALGCAVMSPEEMLAHRWVLSPDVVEVREHRPGEEAPRAIALLSTSGIARRVTADPLLAAALGACDGELTLGQIAGALAILLEVDEEAASTALVTGLRELTWLGMVALASEPAG